MNSGPNQLQGYGKDYFADTQRRMSLMKNHLPHQQLSQFNNRDKSNSIVSTNVHNIFNQNMSRFN